MASLPALSPQARQAALLEMGRKHFDLVVIGGGICGAGIAHEAAARGLSVALVERLDFSSGTSSKSSKMLHGGLRYLEQFRFHLVGEALMERNRLFRQVPHLARELPFIYPVESGRRLTLWQARLGITVYETLSSLTGFSASKWHGSLDPDALRAEEPCFEKADLIGALRYVDGLTDDARLVIDVVKAASLLGATVANYCQAEGFSYDRAHRVTGVIARDALGGEPFEIRGHAVVNAAGPWLDAVNRLDRPDAPRKLLPTKGIHVVVPSFTHGHALILKTLPHADGRRRYMFVIPWGERSLIGTTDTANPGTADGDGYLDRDTHATADEVGYLLGSVNAACPGMNLRADDVISAFGGWRPLVAPAHAEFESDISREHEIFETPSGIWCLAGGKLTTYRVMARQLVDRVARSLRAAGCAAGGRVPRARVVPYGGPTRPEELAALVERERAGAAASEARMVGRLAQVYGSGFRPVLDIARAEGRLAGEIGNLSAEVPFWRAQVAFAVRHEGALSVADVLARRLRIQLVDAFSGLGCLAEVADLVGREVGESLGWSRTEAVAWAQREAERYEAEVKLARGFKTPALR
ncbi:MAG: glycerol-3-phosphate dehydrogenase/oxidase [Candidatus Sericytochromatia bacterium]|nr:glycerol-3-phosphate dehydrogenase/oxidase [Candidatus Tanganyikabacteria bacterium]